MKNKNNNPRLNRIKSFSSNVTDNGGEIEIGELNNRNIDDNNDSLIKNMNSNITISAEFVHENDGITTSGNE